MIDLDALILYAKTAIQQGDNPRVDPHEWLALAVAVKAAQAYRHHVHPYKDEVGSTTGAVLDAALAPFTADPKESDRES